MSPVRTWSPLHEAIDFRSRRHRWSRAVSRHGDAGDGAAEARSIDDIHPLGESDGEAAVEGVTRASRFHHRTSIECSDMLGDARVLHQNALCAEGDHDIAHAASEQRSGGTFRVIEI